jgi:hypothetical protein
MKEKPLRKFSYIVCFSLFLFVVFSTALVPVNSNDFWWHLKTGQYIIESKTLPSYDPFTYTAIPEDPEYPGRPEFILKQYWLSQVIYALLFDASGINGIIVFRGLIFLLTGFLLIFIIRIHSSGRGSLIPLFLYALSMRVTLEDSDRPQIFIFLAALAVIAVSELSAKRKSKALPFLNIPIMLLASNLHGGYIAGVVYLFVYALCSLFEERLSFIRKPLIISGFLAFSATYFNPTHWYAFIELLHRAGPAAFSSTIMEHGSPLKILPYTLSHPGWLSYWAMVVVSLPATVYLFIKRRWSLGIMLSGCLAASLESMRYIAFFLPLAASFTALFINEMLPKKEGRGFPLEAAAGILLFALILAKPFHPNRFGPKVSLQEMTFPVSAVDFINKEKLPQPVFNKMEWGGYLEWRLWPEYKMFIDTRQLINGVYMQYFDIAGYTPGGRALVDSYGIATVVMPAINPYTGEIIPLARGLYRNPAWSLVYADGQAAIFVRKGLYWKEIPKNKFYYEVLSEIRYWRPLFPWAKGYEGSEAEALKGSGIMEYKDLLQTPS